LSDNYGDRAWAVAAVASQTGSTWPIYGRRLAAGYPYIEAEVRYACQREYACTAVDVIARRTRLSFLNARACLEALPRIIEIMAGEHGWDRSRREKEYKDAADFLLTMGLSIKDRIAFPGVVSGPDSVLTQDEARFFKRTYFAPEEMGMYKLVFAKLDADRDGSISKADLTLALKEIGVKMTPTEVAQAVAEVDLNRSGSVEFTEFLEVLAAVKDIRSRSKFARIVAEYQDREKVDTDRSGGGV
jgi:glycerol-3-phosphate dehydrogenase